MTMPGNKEHFVSEHIGADKPAHASFRLCRTPGIFAFIWTS